MEPSGREAGLRLCGGSAFDREVEGRSLILAFCRVWAWVGHEGLLRGLCCKSRIRCFYPPAGAACAAPVIRAGISRLQL